VRRNVLIKKWKTKITNFKKVIDEMFQLKHGGTKITNLGKYEDKIIF